MCRGLTLLECCNSPNDLGWVIPGAGAGDCAGTCGRRFAPFSEARLRLFCPAGPKHQEVVYVAWRGLELAILSAQTSDFSVAPAAPSLSSACRSRREHRAASVPAHIALPSFQARVRRVTIA